MLEFTIVFQNYPKKNYDILIQDRLVNIRHRLVGEQHVELPTLHRRKTFPSYFKNWLLQHYIEWKLVSQAR